MGDRSGGIYTPSPVPSFHRSVRITALPLFVHYISICPCDTAVRHALISIVLPQILLEEIQSAQTSILNLSHDVELWHRSCTLCRRIAGFRHRSSSRRSERQATSSERWQRLHKSLGQLDRDGRFLHRLGYGEVCNVRADLTFSMS